MLNKKFLFCFKKIFLYKDYNIFLIFFKFKIIFMKNLKWLLISFLFIGCEPDKNDIVIEPVVNQWVFVACEGNYGASNGSISMINQLGEVKHVKEMGDVVQSVEVYKNKLFVIINNSHKIKAFDITSEGLRLPGIEIDTDGSSPREMKIINKKLYFTNWNSSDVKILNLDNYLIEGSIAVEGKPESIEVEGTNLWVGIQMNNDYSDGNKLLKISTVTNSIVETFEIGKGPTSITIQDNNVYIANTFYDANYNAFYGSSRLNIVNKEVDISYYGAGIVCGGDVLSYNNSAIFRSFEGGAALLGNDLNILEQTKIGSYDPSQLYSSEIIDGIFYFGITNYNDINQVKIVDFNNTEIATYDVGLFPGDFAIWKSN